MTLYKGRRKIVTEYKPEDMMNKTKLAKLLNVAFPIHLQNKQEIDYLVNYRNGDQPILSKTKDVRPEINNILVINHAQMITRSIVGYFLGTPIQYIQSGADGKEEIDKLNKFISYEDKSSVDKEIGEYQSVCGTGYRIIFTDGLFADEIPFEDRSLNPATTFVVYENNIAERPVVGITYYSIYDDKGTAIGMKIFAYTAFGVWEINTYSIMGNIAKNDKLIWSPYDVGGVPIIEYPNNMWRIGDWELCLTLMDAINDMNSGRLDDIDQIVQSLLVFINADIDATKFEEMRVAGAISLKNTSTNHADAKSITNALDQSGMNLFAKELESYLYSMIGIPDRESRGGSGGGDTGMAVELRDGWADLETVARNKELVYKRSEKQALRIMLKILENKMGFTLSLLNVEIKFSRNKNNNLLVKTQSYATLIATKTLSPADCLIVVDLVSDVNEFMARGELFWGDSFAGKVQAEIAVETSKVSLETAKNPTKEITVEKEKNKQLKDI